MAVIFKTCPLFEESFANIASARKIIARFEEFKKWKSENPIKNFGSKDEPLIRKGPFGEAVPGIKHAHLTQDVSVWYTIEGRDPTVIKLYGIFTHAQSGTGQPQNFKKSQALATRMANQQFS